ncbi:MAG: ATP synthase F1 subunit delta [Longimicrobiaceae bacterium]
MRAPLVARNYADTLFALARSRGGDAAEEYGRGLEELSSLLDREPRIRAFLETPRVALEAKRTALREALGGRMPPTLLHFLLVVLEKRRQGSLGEIAEAYQALVDEAHGRARAEVTLAEPPDDALRSEIVAALERRLGKQVVASWRTDRDLLGGVVVRVGDQVLDGSVRRRLGDLRGRLRHAGAAGAGAEITATSTTR